MDTKAESANVVVRGTATLLLLLACGPASAETIRLTMYDDGLSCPAACDAHVVFHKTLNGTEFAHDPATPAAPFGKCVNGSTCSLCLESDSKQCLEAIYRGGGPAPKTFDFTPRFYESACAATPPQEVLALKCAELKKAAKSLEGRINCIATPDAQECVDLIHDAMAARKKDRVEYDRCISLGESTYNATKPDEEKRSLNCAYEFKGTGGPNSRGTTWRRLLPGACRDGSFVGRDGLDCCSGSTLADGPLGRECSLFYPQKDSA